MNMNTNIDLIRMCTNGYYNNLFNTTCIEVSMVIIAKAMIFDGLY